MSSTWNTDLWQQFGAAIDTLDDALRACPDALWRAPLWGEATHEAAYAEFWYLAYHTLFWLDLYLSGAVEGFAPPVPFNLDELDPAGLLPATPYTRAELRAYLAHCRSKCKAVIEALTDERARQLCHFRWGDISMRALLFYNMRHVQEHAAQLNMLLGQMIGSAPGWVIRARE